MIIIFFILASITGSFIGLLVFRLPRNQNFIFSRSFCENCGHIIPFYRNIPIISFLIQRGRCKYCNSKIDFCCFLLEILTPLVIIVLYLRYGISIGFFYKSLIYGLLLLISFIDMKIKIILDRLCFTLIFLTFLHSIFFYNLEKWYLGAAAYSFPLLFLYSLSDLLKSKRELIGFGDIKLLFGIGGLILYENLAELLVFYELLYIFTGIFCISGISLKILNKKNYIAFAPFIVLAAFLMEFRYV